MSAYSSKFILLFRSHTELFIQSVSLNFSIPKQLKNGALKHAASDWQL